MQIVIKDVAWAIHLISLLMNVLRPRLQSEVFFFIIVKQAQIEQLNKEATNCYQQP